MTRADAVRAAQGQIIELTAAAGAVNHQWTDRPTQPAYRSHTATIELVTAFPHAKNPGDLEHLRAGLAQIAEVAPGMAQVSWNAFSIAAHWTEELP